MNVTLMKYLALFLGFALWAALGYLGKVPLDPLIALLQMGLGGLVTHMLQADSGYMSTPKPGKSLDSTQAGFALTRLLGVIAAIALGLAMLAGCTTTTGAMYAGIAKEAKAGIQLFDDNTLTTVHDILCAQPYSAIQRHPELQPGIVALCGPLVNTASLDPAQVVQMLSIAKQLGLGVPPAAPAAAASNAGR